jgi:SnoaL-like domain
MLAEDCWSDDAGAERMRAYIGPGYVHHTVDRDWTFDQWKAGLAWVDGYFADRVYAVQHVVVDGELSAAFLRWRATRRTDGSPVEGTGAYHCRIVDGLIQEDWDVFFPLP